MSRIDISETVQAYVVVSHRLPWWKHYWRALTGRATADVYPVEIHSRPDGEPDENTETFTFTVPLD